MYCTNISSCLQSRHGGLGLTGNGHCGNGGVGLSNGGGGRGGLVGDSSPSLGSPVAGDGR